MDDYFWTGLLDKNCTDTHSFIIVSWKLWGKYESITHNQTEGFSKNLLPKQEIWKFIFRLENNMLNTRSGCI